MLHRMMTRPERSVAGDDEPLRIPRQSVSDDAPAFGRVRGLRFHQQARLGGSARAYCAAARDDRRAPVRPARNESARSRAAGHPGCRDRRAVVRGHPRPPTFRERFSEAAERRENRAALRVPQGGASMRSSLRRRTISSMRCMRFADLRKRRSQLAGGGGLPQHHRGEHMKFPWPHLLWLLAIVPLLVAAYLYVLRRKKKARRPLRESRDDARCARRPADACAGTCRRFSSCSRSSR